VVGVGGGAIALGVDLAPQLGRVEASKPARFGIGALNKLGNGLRPLPLRRARPEREWWVVHRVFLAG
jgi:hypothetical protein